MEPQQAVLKALETLFGTIPWAEVDAFHRQEIARTLERVKKVVEKVLSTTSGSSVAIVNEYANEVSSLRTQVRLCATGAEREELESFTDVLTGVGEMLRRGSLTANEVSGLSHALNAVVERLEK